MNKGWQNDYGHPLAEIKILLVKSIGEISQGTRALLRLLRFDSKNMAFKREKNDSLELIKIN